MSASLRLGDVDQGAMPTNLEDYLRPYHDSLGMAVNMNPPQFRDEVGWHPFNQRTDHSVAELQQFLKDAGFLPNFTIDGVFGYRTQAAARLFQEYVRTIEGGSPYLHVVPDGLVKNDTWANIETWKRQKAGRYDFVCDWGKFSRQNPSADFLRWIHLLELTKAAFSAVKSTHPIVGLVENYNGESDTKKVDDWDTTLGTVHLIGIRRSWEDQEWVGKKREGDDLFILLLNGMVFKFWGSTYPSSGLAEKSALLPTIPVLIEGQHVYRFGWNYQIDPDKIYQVLCPNNRGVLAFQNWDGDLTPTDNYITKGLDLSPNPTISIHWSGVERFNFTAGNQVIAGNSYINHRGEFIDCKSFAAHNRDILMPGKFTRGAYNVFSDLIMSYAPPGLNTIHYLLGRDEWFRSIGWEDKIYVSADVNRLQQGVEVRHPKVKVEAHRANDEIKRVNGPNPGKGNFVHRDGNSSAATFIPIFDQYFLHFDGIYPSPFCSNTWQDMLVYVYYKSALKKVIADFERRKQQLSGEFTGTSAESQAHIPLDSLLTIIPDIPSVVCEPSSFQFRMTDDYHCQPFRVMHKTTPLLEKMGRGRIKGSVRIYLETLVIGEIPVESEWEMPGYVAPVQPTMVSTFAAQPQMMAATTGESFKRQTAQAFRKIFASFSESDKPIIERLEKAYKALGDDYWHQYQRLRAGQDRTKAIEEAIQDSDVFQLCWSNNAKTAENVEREWRLAIALAKENFIRPIYWEKPMPEPPEELRHLYFDYYQVET